MISGWNYLLLVNLYVSLFFGFYWIALRKDTFFTLNRVYLIAAIMLSLVLPFAQFNWLQDAPVTQRIASAVLTKDVLIYAGKQPAAQAQINGLDITAIIVKLYLTGVVFFAGRLLFRIYAINRLLAGGIAVSCSFFNKINLTDNVRADSPIYEHEMVHVRQWHSADVMLMELFAIINWFNPLVYLYKKTIKQVHEFIADREALHGTSKHEYASLLLSQTFEIPNTLVNTFFNNSLLKQRIMMIDKKKSRRAALLKYGLCVPLFMLMLGISAAMAQTDKAKKEKVTEITIDPPAKPYTGKVEGDPVFTAVEKSAEFPGGINKFYEFLGRNLRYPAAMRQHNAQGRVILQFIVERDGSLTNFKILKDVSYGAGEEAVRVMKTSPKWIPGKQNGRAVRELYTIPVTFSLADGKK